MKKSFLICSLYGRLVPLTRLLSSLKEYTDWNIFISLQMYPKSEIAIIQEHCKKCFGDKFQIFSSDIMTGPHLARCKIFDEITSDVWCILDDDMYAVKGFTHYDEMSQVIFSHRNIGLLSSNWRKTENMLQKVKLQDKLSSQNIVYTGGGMMLRQELADIIRNIPRAQYLFDNPLWSIYSYTQGFENYRYLNSAAVHEICTKGGRRKWISECDSYKRLPPPELLRVRKGKGKAGKFDEYLICDSTDITEYAKQMHIQAKKRREKEMKQL